MRMVEITLGPLFLEIKDTGACCIPDIAEVLARGVKI